MEWLNQPVSSVAVVIVLGWIVVSVPALCLWLNEDYSKNPFKNTWLHWDEERYNLVGKIILTTLTVIIVLPGASGFYVFTGILWVARKIVGLFDLIFKKKKKEK